MSVGTKVGLSGEYLHNDGRGCKTPGHESAYLRLTSICHIFIHTTGCRRAIFLRCEIDDTEIVEKSNAQMKLKGQRISKV